MPRCDAGSSSLDLADAPALGKTDPADARLITHRIRIAGIDARRYKLPGSPRACAEVRGYRVPEQEIVAAAKQFLLTCLPWNADDITIDSNRPFGARAGVGGEDIRFEASLQRPAASRWETVRVDVAVSRKGVKQAEVAVSLEVGSSLPASRWRCAESTADQTLTHEDIVYETRVVDASPAI